jgi:hypothetical protein
VAAAEVEVTVGDVALVAPLVSIIVAAAVVVVVVDDDNVDKATSHAQPRHRNANTSSSCAQVMCSALT